MGGGRSWSFRIGGRDEMRGGRVGALCMHGVRGIMGPERQGGPRGGEEWSWGSFFW